jgi:hypothetical protein
MYSLSKIDTFKLGKKENVHRADYPTGRGNFLQIPGDCRKMTPFTLLFLIYFIDYALFLKMEKFLPT